MSKKKKKKEVPLEELPVLPNDYAAHTGILAGMTTEEIIRLLESLGRIDGRIVVSRRRPVKGKNISKEVGGKQRRMNIEQAIEYEKQRAEEREAKEQKVIEISGVDAEIFDHGELSDEIYPQRLTPNDIARGLEAAQEKLEEEERAREQRKRVIMPKQEAILGVLTEIKKHEAIRVAQKIAERQREMVLGKTLEELQAEREKNVRQILGIPEPHEETPEEKEKRIQREEEALREATRTLEGFSKDNTTLIDEAGEMVNENVDAAAAVLRQWIGTTVESG